MNDVIGTICVFGGTLFIAIIGLAAAWGALGQKVKRHDVDIAKIHTENREDHAKIFRELQDINNYIRNNRKG